MSNRPPFARIERGALCDTALELGPDAPTLAGDWTVKEMLCHLLVRERSPIGAPGVVIHRLSGLTDREMARLGREEFEDLVERFRGVPLLSPVRLWAAEAAVNTLEFFVHHEDLRRAQPDWSPRQLGSEAEAALWSSIAMMGRLLVRPAGVPVTLRWAGPSTGPSGRTLRLRGGPDPVVVSGAPGELVLFCFGRAQTQDVTFEGPDDAVRRLRETSLGI